MAQARGGVIKPDCVDASLRWRTGGSPVKRVAILLPLDVLRQRRRFADAEKRSRFLQILSNIRGKRVHAAKNAPRDSPRVLERRHGLAEIVERGAVGFDERQRVGPMAPRSRKKRQFLYSYPERAFFVRARRPRKLIYEIMCKHKHVLFETFL